MRIQEIIVFLIIFGSVIYTLYSFFNVFKKKPKNSCGCSSSSCDIRSNTKDLKSIIDKKLQ